MYNDRPNISERILRLINPIFRIGARRWPSRFRPGRPKPEHPSAMLTKWNLLYRLLLPRFFKRVSTDQEAIEEIKELAAGSTIVYVAKRIGHLECTYFNQLFQKEDLPLVKFNNAVTLKRWMPWKLYWNTLLWQQSEISRFSQTYNPLYEDQLPKMVAEGASILIQIPRSELLDDSLFLTGSIKPITDLILAGRQSEKPVLIIPLEFIWSRHPERQKKTIVDILFGEKESPGIIRKTVLFWRNYKTQAHAAFGKPIDLKEFIQSGNGSSDNEIATKLRNDLLKSLHAQRKAVTGPIIKPRSWFIQEVTGDDGLDEKICKLAAERDKGADDLRDLAERYIKEIAADIDYTYFEFFDRILGSALGKIYENFDIDMKGLKRAKDIYADGPIILVPNHKSHVDYLVLSHILYQNGMTVPHIAAGINMSFWPLGMIFRRCGAYFIRREFRDNQLYKMVLETYLKILLQEGYCQEFFIEGGRSRTGKLRNPKLGMISMLKHAAAEAGIEKLNFVPVTLTYDRVMETKSYISESEGGAKEEEKRSQLLKLTKFLKKKQHRHGSIYIRFGDPVSVDCISTDHASVQEAGDEISRRINDNTVITPIAVAASAILSEPRRGIPYAKFESVAHDIFDYMKFKDAKMSQRFGDPFKAVMKRAVSQLAANRLIQIHTGTVGTYISTEESKRIQLAFFKNGIIHEMLDIGLLSSLLLSEQIRSKAVSRDELRRSFDESRKHISHEFGFADIGKDFDGALGYLSKIDAISIAASEVISRSGNDLVLQLFASLIRPYMEPLLISLIHTQNISKKELEEKHLIDKMQRSGNDLLMLGRVHYREAINRFDLANTLKVLTSKKVLALHESTSGRKRQKLYSRTKNREAEKNLQVALEELL